MNKFIGTKEVKARPLNLGAYNALRGWTLPLNENPDTEGYLIEYLDSPNKNHPDYDNYISWSPKDVFERSYRINENLTFGQAIEAAKQGKRIARQGWNGKGMFAYIVPAASYPAQTGAAKQHFGENSLVPYRAYWALKTVQEDIATWTPSGSDTLAEDWLILN
jgi:hypothetical protein